MAKIPVSVFTGYLGSGKTTIILNLIKQLDPDYKVVWLKNEYGDTSIDSLLAKESNIQTAEMLNGCLCCVLVGRLKNALEEIVQNYHPDRIIVESSGTAYPMPIVFEINRIPEIELDGVVNVIDALNFTGYRDAGVVAKMQASYTDLIIINKVGLVNEQRLDEVKDHIFELNPTTPKLESADGNVSAEVLLGIDSKLVLTQVSKEPIPHEQDDHHHEDEVETFTWRGDIEMLEDSLLDYLNSLRNKGFIRIKGVIKWPGGKYQLINWVSGRATTQILHKYNGQSVLVFMGKGVSAYAEVVKQKLG
ncbi:MAG: GTP-binding protein [Candidatus Doudnabacteria bacterium]|nr:GTP-binding protein [Candidatus Doudnabacteria bacterium]